MKCIIIEDELPAQEILRAYIEKIPDFELVEVFKSPLKANTLLNQEVIDVIFLDINLPTISGLNFLKTLKNPPNIVMTTAYSNYAAESFEYDTIIDYLVKPFSFERFLKAVNKLESHKNNLGDKTLLTNEVINVSKDEEAVFINVDKTLHKVVLNHIMYVQSDRNYVTIVTKDIKLSFIDTLKKWINYLSVGDFIQIHKSYIVNVNYVEKVTGNIVYINSEKIPVGRAYKDDLFDRIKPIN